MKASATSDLTVGGRTSRRTLSRSGWSMSANSSSGLSSSAEASPRCPATLATSSNCWPGRRLNNGVMHLRYRIPT
jgi:hypothetical protein